MTEYLLLLLVPVMSWLDRQRGMPKAVETIPKLPALLGIGYLCAAMTGHFADWQAVVITAVIAVAHNFSFGQPLGMALTGKTGAADDGTVYEAWQVGILRTNCWLALALRGAVLGVAGLAAYDFAAALKIAAAWAVAFPAAPAIVRYVLKMPVNTANASGKAWAANEWIRGALAGLFLSMAVIFG